MFCFLFLLGNVHVQFSVLIGQCACSVFCSYWAVCMFCFLFLLGSVHVLFPITLGWGRGGSVHVLFPITLGGGGSVHVLFPITRGGQCACFISHRGGGGGGSVHVLFPMFRGVFCMFYFPCLLCHLQRETGDVWCLPLLSGISGLLFDSPFLSPLLFFCQVLLLFLSCHFSAYGLVSGFFSHKKLSNIFYCIQVRLFHTALVEQLGDDRW